MTHRQLLQRAIDLTDDVKEVLTRTSPEDVEQEMLARDDFRNEMQDFIDDLGEEIRKHQNIIDAEKDLIENIKAIRSRLRTAKTKQQTAIDRLKAHKFHLYHSRKNHGL